MIAFTFYSARPSVPICAPNDTVLCVYRSYGMPILCYLIQLEMHMIAYTSNDEMQKSTKQSL